MRFARYGRFSIELTYPPVDSGFYEVKGFVKPTLRVVSQRLDANG